VVGPTDESLAAVYKLELHPNSPSSTVVVTVNLGREWKALSISKAMREWLEIK
jgi:hypothetical protein